MSQEKNRNTMLAVSRPLHWSMLVIILAGFDPAHAQLKQLADSGSVVLARTSEPSAVLLCSEYKEFNAKLVEGFAQDISLAPMPIITEDPQAMGAIVGDKVFFLIGGPEEDESSRDCLAGFPNFSKHLLRLIDQMRHDVLEEDPFPGVKLRLPPGKERLITKMEYGEQWTAMYMIYSIPDRAPARSALTTLFGLRADFCDSVAACNFMGDSHE